MPNLRALTRAHRFYGGVDAKQAYVPVTSFVGNGFAVGTNISNQGLQFDYISRLSDMYAYFKGGLSYKILMEQPADNGVLFPGEIYTAITRRSVSGDHFNTNPLFGRGAFHITRSDVTPVHEVMVSFYSNTRKQVCNMALQSWCNSKFPGVAMTGYQKINGKQVPASYDIYRAAKDDFSFGCLIGCADISETVSSPLTLGVAPTANVKSWAPNAQPVEYPYDDSTTFQAIVDQYAQDFGIINVKFMILNAQNEVIELSKKVSQVGGPVKISAQPDAATVPKIFMTYEDKEIAGQLTSLWFDYNMTLQAWGDYMVHLLYSPDSYAAKFYIGGSILPELAGKAELRDIWQKYGGTDYLNIMKTITVFLRPNPPP
jgi:hypothetical protein